MVTYIYSNSGIPDTGGRSFIRQCFVYLLTMDILDFIIVAFLVLVVSWTIRAIIKILEDN